MAESLIQKLGQTPNASLGISRQKVASIVLWIIIGLAVCGALIVTPFLVSPAANRWLQMEIFQTPEMREARARIAFFIPECPASQAAPTGQDRGCALFLTLTDGRVAQITRVEIINESALTVYGSLSPFDVGTTQIPSALIRNAGDYANDRSLYAGLSSTNLTTLMSAWAAQAATPQQAQ